MTSAYASDFVGVGLRDQHLEFFYSNPNTVPWLEVHSENYFLPHSQNLSALLAIREHTQISCHGIGLSLGSVSSVSQSHLSQLITLINTVEPMFVSDHLSWSEFGGHYYNDLLPLPYTDESLAIFCRNVSQVQEAIGRTILIENPSSYLRFEHSHIPEWQFLAEVQARTGCRLLLDLNNVYVSCFNHNYSTEQYLATIDPSTVDEIHLAGFTTKQFEQGEILIDTHGQPVSDQVWALYSDWVSNNGPIATLIEWDTDIPEPSVLLQEAAKATDILAQLPHVKQRA